MKKFRNHQPQRTFTGKQKSNYKDYRVQLRNDFLGRCAYTDCSDFWWADGFHVDHFAPKKPDISDPVKFNRFKERENLYSNLIYSCPQINRAKGNDWPSDDPDVSVAQDSGYLDPCDVDFNEYFHRTDSGEILHKDNPIAAYMWRKLKLYLKRYTIYWRLDQITERQDRLIQLKEKFKSDNPIQKDILTGIVELTIEYSKYRKYLQLNYLSLNQLQ